MTACNSFIEDKFRFPARPANRAALARIGYRIARYGDLIEAMARRINTAVELEHWTHRGADDPAFALLEGAAIVGDILTFYQEHYANEAFLRTARWRESVADLVRLTGYRLAPALGGRATFAFEVKGDKAVVVPKGLALKADLADIAETAEFQTSADLTAWPHLSRFNLYRSRDYDSYLTAGKDVVEIRLVGGKTTAAAFDDLALKAGDKLMLVPAEPSWTVKGSSISTPQEAPQTVEVKSVKRRLGRTIVTLKTTLAASWTAPALAYRLGRSFRHFGHNAPKTYIANTTDASSKINGACEHKTSFDRHLDTSHDCGKTSASIDLPATMIPLDSQFDDLMVESRLVIRTRIRQTSGGTAHALTAVRQITGLRTTSLGFAGLNGASTLVTLDSPLIGHTDMKTAVSDVRDYQLLEITSPALCLDPLANTSSAKFANGAKALNFFGTQAEARTLAGRKLVLKDDATGTSVALYCTNEPAHFLGSTSAAGEARMWLLSFDKAPMPFTRADFDEEKPTVTAFANLVEATQGKAQAEVVLGNGDARQRFQTFKLPKAPLTYLLASGQTPPYAPELTIYVGGRAWRRTASLFGRKGDEEVYIVRQDAEGDSYVQFGDGITGARLPSGVKNVKASYRSGAGAYGALKSGSTPSAGKRVDGLDKVQLPGLVTGGEAAEAMGRARMTAPGRVQSLGRLVSLKDFETEVLTIPGVTAATASWGLEDGMPTLLLRVLMARGREGEFKAVRATIADYQRCRGADRFAVATEQAWLRYLFLSLDYGFDPRLQRADVEAAIKTALGLVDDDDAAWTGLFGLGNRRLGAREYATRIEGVVQQVTGVSWCRVAGLGLFKARQDDPQELTAPKAPQPRAKSLAPAAGELLQLHQDHLSLTAVLPEVREDCA
jgi:hypothetical protein